MGPITDTSLGSRGERKARAVTAGIASVAAPALLAAGLLLEDFRFSHLPAMLPPGLFSGSAFSGSAAEVERYAAGGVALGALAVVAWWLLAWGAAVASALLQRAGRPAAALRVGRLSPRFIRRLAAATLGTHLVLAPAAQAAAPAPTIASVPAPAPAVGTESGNPPERVPDPRWTPERPAAPLERILGGGRDATAREAGGVPQEVVVRAGDSLWSIAARSLGEHATAAEIAREWPRWYRANRAVVGENPDLLLVGTVLVRPAGNPGQ